MKVKGFLSVSVALLCLQVYAADLYVANYGGDIQTAVDAAAPGDTVWVEDGTYVLSAQINVTKAITVRGINGPSVAMVDGGGSNRCFNLSDVPCILRDLTITGGYIAGWPDDRGAGIYCDESNQPVVSNCVIEANAASPNDYCFGGGLFGGTAIDCIIRNNSAWGGGGSDNAILVRCLVEDNHAQESGGGLSGGSATNCVIINNSAIPDSPIVEGSPGGGGSEGADTVGCAISGNTTTGGGGGVRWGTHRNSTITANTASYGGGAYNADELYNCIIWHNTITGSGDFGGPELEDFIALAAEPYVSGSDVADCWDVQYSCTPEANLLFGEGNITNDPVLVSFSHISTNSPCIAAGTNAYAIGVDIDLEMWADPPSMGCDENHGAGTLTGPLGLSISGPEAVATDFTAEFNFLVEGIPTLVVVSIDGNGSVTNPIGSVEASWSTPGTNNIILTAFNETYPSGVSHTQEVVVVSAAASAIHVSDSSGNDANDGSGWLLAKQTLQAGIDAQDVVGGWVLVADGTYTNELFPVYLDRPVTLQSTNSAASTIIDAGGMDRCVEISDAGATLNGFTVQNGFTYDTGAGIYCTLLDATVRDCIIRNNYSDFAGGGMAGGTAVNCHILANESDGDGAGIRDTTAIGCVLADNKAIDGYAAAYLSELRNCTVVGNHAAYGSGGAFDCDLFNSIVWYNTCDSPDEGDNISYGTWANVCSPDVDHGVAGSITNEPMLASISHLMSGSPCIGAGDAAEAQETDIDGEAWLSPPAIGCDEFNGTVVGDIDLSISGITQCAVGTTAEYGFIAIGPVTQTVADFGDGTVVTNPIATVSKTWSIAGMHDVVFTAWNDTYPAGTSVTQLVDVVSLAGSTIHVALDGNDLNDGTSWALAKETIQAGVDAQSIYGGRVLVSNGTFVVSSAVTIDFPLKLVGFGGYEDSIIDGGGTVRGIEIAHPGAVIADLCITNGYGTTGGGIYCLTTGPVITNCLITACQGTSQGGGVYFGTLVDSMVVSNRSNYGGGLAQSVAVRCLISDNEAYQTSSYTGSGGGTYFSDLTACTVVGNSAGRYGGGTFYGETYSCLIADNTAYRGGGVMYGAHNNATITTNQVTSSGGGAYAASMHNCILFGNLRNSVQDDDRFSTMYNTCSPNVVHGSNGNITNAPAFVDAAAGNYRLAAGSPCVDAGDNAYVALLVDLDGNARMVGSSVDMGAYEYSVGAPLDSDGDGVLDADELIAGTGVNDSNSFFHVESAATTGSGTTLGWTSVSNRLYSVYWTDDLVGQSFTLLTNGLTGGSFEDVAHAGVTNGFYLIRVELAP